MSPKTVLWSLLLVVGLSVLVGGCIFDPEEKKVEPVPPQPFLDPTTPDNLMSNFGRAYDEMNLQEYQKVLHEDYRFIPLDADRDRLGLSPTDYVLRPQELAISQKIFSGAAGTDGAPGIQDIVVDKLEAITTWESTGELIFQPALEASFYVEIKFVHAYGLFQVKGQQKFWVRNVPVDGKDQYYLVGQQDDTRVGPY